MQKLSNPENKFSKDQVSGVQVSGVQVSGVQVSGVQVSGVQVSGVQLSKVQLSKVQMSISRFFSNTVTQTNYQHFKVSEDSYHYIFLLRIFP